MPDCIKIHYLWGLGDPQPLRRSDIFTDAARDVSVIWNHQDGYFVLWIIALWWWFCPCRVGGAVWNHTAWLFPVMPLPTESLFYSYFLSRNKYRKNITCKNIGQFQFCINLLPLALIWRSAPYALKSKMIWRCCIHKTFGKTMGPHVTMVNQLIVRWNLRKL